MPVAKNLHTADPHGSRPVVTLTTDFGSSSPYVAAMKGVLLTINPELQLVDITHATPPQNIRHAAVNLADTVFWFPPGAIHIVVVDPGVGTCRRILAVRSKGHYFIAPDNGVLESILRASTPDSVVELTAEEYRLDHVSPTFHGRDIMAPAAAHLSLGLGIGQLGHEITDPIRLTWPAPTRREAEVLGEIILADSFGNLITNVTLADLKHLRQIPQVVYGEGERAKWVTTYAEAEPGDIVALLGSSGGLEIAVVNGNAADTLDARAGTPVILSASRTDREDGSS